MRAKKILLFLLIIYALVTWVPQLLGPAVDSVSQTLDSQTTSTMTKEHLR